MSHGARQDTLVVHAVGTNEKVAKLKKWGHWYFETGCRYHTPETPLLGNVDMEKV